MLGIFFVLSACLLMRKVLKSVYKSCRLLKSYWLLRFRLENPFLLLSLSSEIFLCLRRLPKERLIDPIRFFMEFFYFFIFSCLCCINFSIFSSFFLLSDYTCDYGGGCIYSCSLASYYNLSEMPAYWYTSSCNLAERCTRLGINSLGWVARCIILYFLLFSSLTLRG